VGGLFILLRVKRVKIDVYGMCAIAIIAFATLLRIVLTALGWPQTNSDEGTMGLMALHIANHGEHPIFFYGQNYMGPLEAYLGAALFHLFGSSLFMLRLGTILLFTLFLTAMYLLTSMLYSQKLALITVGLLSLGSSLMLDIELVALGGYPELLLFGSLSLLIVAWLALSQDQYASPRKRLWRYVVYCCWGLVVGIGFWSDFLMLAFIAMSGLFLVIFCWRELLQGAVLFLFVGLAIGALPLILYSLKAAPGQDLLTVLSYLHNQGSFELAHNHAYKLFPWLRQIRGAMLITLPSATGGPIFCADSMLRLSGYLSLQASPCSIAEGGVLLALLALCWSLGYLVLWAVAVLLGIKALWNIWRHTPGKPRPPAGKLEIVRQSARLMLLGSAGLILLLFLVSPAAAVFPVNARYLIGLLVSTPALIAPLWSLSSGHSQQAFKMDSYKGDSSWVVRFPFSVNLAMIKVVLQRGLLLLIGIVLLVGTIRVFFEIPDVRASGQRQDALINRLLRDKATHIYSDYWTCDRIAFLSREQIICASLDAHLDLYYNRYTPLDPYRNRYTPYFSIVKADPNAAYVFLSGSAQAVAIAKQEAVSGNHYRRFVFEGYVIDQPESSFPNVSN
jgi:hypothetical protein